MAEFDTVVNLGLEVDDGDLRSARRAIESGLGDVSVGAGGGAAARATDGGTAGGGRRQRRMFRWARERTGHLEDVVALLGDIEENIGGGGGSGGGGLLSAIGGISILSRLGGVAGGTIGAGAVMSAITWPTITKSAVLGATFSGITITAAAILGAITFKEIAAGDLVGAMSFGSITGALVLGAIFGATTITGGAVIGAIFSGLSIAVGDVMSAVFPNVDTKEGDILGAIFAGLSITAAGVLTAVFGISMTPALVLGAIFGGVVITTAAVLDFLFEKSQTEEGGASQQTGDEQRGTRGHQETSNGTFDTTTRTELPTFDAGADGQGGGVGAGTGGQVGGSGGAEGNAGPGPRGRPIQTGDTNVTVEMTGEEWADTLREEREREIDELRRDLERSLGGRPGRGN